MSGGARAFAMSMGATTTNQGSSQLPCSGVTDTWTVYGYARVSRGRDDGTDTLQNQRLWLTGAAGVGVDAARIHQDIITGTVFQRPGLNDLLNVVQAGDVLMVTALDRLGCDTLGLLELVNRLATMGVELKVLYMSVDAQDVAGGGQLVALVTAGVAAIERANISQRTKQGLERARAEGKLAGRRWSISRARMRTIQWASISLALKHKVIRETQNTLTGDTNGGRDRGKRPGGAVPQRDEERPPGGQGRLHRVQHQDFPIRQRRGNASRSPHHANLCRLMASSFI